MEERKISFGSWEAAVLPASGMNTVALRYDGKAVLREPGSYDQLRQMPYLYGTALLFPPNRTAGGEFSFEGQTYRLPINEKNHGNHLHGVLHSAPFAVTYQDEHRVEGKYECGREIYPFPFSVQTQTWLDGEGYHQKIRITNAGTSTMQVPFGIHATFVEPTWFSVPLLDRWETDPDFIPTGSLLELEEDQKQYVEGCSPRGKNVGGFYRAEGREAQIGPFSYRVSEHFDQWILYNGGGGKGLLCVEPQCGPVNALNRENSCPLLEPWGTIEFETAIIRREA